ncbi:MAG: hypothetical protein QOK39_115 [Acidimicrobiaceae bacterium]|jgi:hypothetical protein|nr:hypothetical protein [Acidimicrobiaceae bacterium]
MPGAQKTLTAAYSLDASGVAKGVEQADKHLSGLDAAFAAHERAGASSFGLLGKSLSGALGGSLGPIVDVGEKVKGVIEGIRTRINELEKSGAPALQRVGTAVAGIGAGAVTAGATLMAIGAPLKQSTDQLKQAISNAGGSWDEWDKKTESAIDHARKFASAKDINNALAELTTDLKDPAKAFDVLGKVEDMAAQKHMGVAEMAAKVGKAYENPTKLAKLFGDTVTTSTKSEAAAVAAGKVHEAALTSLAKAQQALSDLEARDAGVKKLSVAQEQALVHAHEAVTAATAKVTDTTNALTAATSGAQSVNQTFDGVMQHIATQTHGQMAASTNNLMGTLRGLKNSVEDNVAAFGNKYGPALTGAGAAVGFLGAAMDGAGAIMNHFKTVEEAVTVATEGTTVAEDGMAVSSWAALGPILLVIAAVAAVAAVGYELVTHWKQVSHFIADVWGGIEGLAKTVWGDIEAYFKFLFFVAFPAIATGGLSLLVTYIWHHWTEIEADAVHAWDSITGAVSHGVDTVVGTVEHLPAAIGGAFADAGSWLLTAGENIVIGLWNGIVGMWGWLINKLEDAFKNSLVGKVLSWLGVMSPSTVFADIGKNMMLGTGVGIDDNVDAPVSALKRASQALSTVPFEPPAIVAGSGGSSTPGGAGGGVPPGWPGFGGPGAPPIEIKLTVTLDGKAIGQASYTYLVDHAAVNGQLLPPT